MLFKKYFFYFFIALLVVSCDKDSDNDNVDNTDGFDRSELLSNWSDNIIIPAYDNFQNTLSSLNEVVGTFVSDPNTQSLADVSDYWLDAYKAWQHIEMFDIGLAEVLNYKGKMNIYPVDSDLIDENILTGDYDLNNNNNFDARGLPAVDYMIHGVAENNESIVQIYMSDASYGEYLVALISSMIYNTNLIIEDWNSFRDEFVASTSNTATSALNKMTNDFIYYYEKGLRANKIGIPAGVFSNSPLPTTVEAFYKKDVSKDLLIEALHASRNFFIGKHVNSDIIGASLESYLNFLAISSKNHLSEEILLEFDNAESQINLLNNNFVTQIEEDNMQMLLAYDAIQVLVVSFKVDMLQALSISVDYVDADGD